MGGAKSALGSVTVWAGAVAIVAQLANLAGYSISADDQAAMVNLIQNGVIVVTTVVTMVSSVVAIWGRVRASKEITSALPSAKSS